MSFLFKKTRSLSFGINATMWTVCVVLLLLVGIFFYGFEQHQLNDHIDQVEVLLESIFEQNEALLANEISANQHEAIKHTISAIGAVKGIAALRVFDDRGHLMEWTGDGRRIDLPLDDRRQLQSGPLFKRMVFDGRDYFAYTAAIGVVGETRGYLSVSFDLFDWQRASRQRIVLIVGVSGGVLMVLSALLHLQLTRSVVRPVSQIRNAMDRVMQGHLGEQVTLDCKDEIGEVAVSFNAMSVQLKEQRQRILRSMELRNSYAEQLEETNRKLARLNINLEGIVEERTRELRARNEQLGSQIQERVLADQAKHALEVRLARSQKMEALGLLAGGVAHDLNNVLSGIVSYPELILMDLSADDPTRSMVAAIQKSGQKAAAIVQDLLALARRGVTHTSVLNLNNDIIHDYLDSPEFDTMQSYYPGVVVETRLCPDLMNIRGSAIHLKKTVMNLIFNAAEAQSQGGRVVIATENRYVDRPLEGYDSVNEGDYVVLQVQDKGSGIAPEDLNRIFEPFYSKKKMGRSGTGLGMAVVWGTVQDHHGYINVASRLNQGTTFDLYFPVTRESVDKGSEAVSVLDYMGQREKVLVVDDMEEQREIAATLLTRLNYDVVCVPSGEAALVYLQGHRVDLIVLDMIMDPGIDGLETYAGILEIHPHQKAIIASGYAENQRVRQALTLGAGGYIRKPYTLEKIATAIRAELDR
jgi:signal transduction histidine kinase